MSRLIKTHMGRRDFLRTSAAAGAMTLAAPRLAFAQSAPN